MANTQELIYETARHLFLENDYEKVTINDICKAAGITKSTFYYHVKSKQDIVVHYYDQIVNNLTPMLIDLLDAPNAWDQIVTLFTRLIADVQSYGAGFNSQVIAISLKENLRTFDMRQELKDIAIKIITKGQEAGEFRNPNKAEKLYEAAAFMFTGYEVMWCVKNGDFPWREEFLASVENILDVEDSLRKFSSSC